LGISQEIGQNADGFRMRLAATGYYTYIKGLMTRRSLPLPNGSYFVWVDGFEYETRAMVNATYGIIKGLSAEVQARYGKNWSLESNLSLTKGGASFEVKDDVGTVVFDTLAPLDHIPPVHGFTSLTFTGQKFKVSAVARYQMAKTPDLYGVSDVKLDGNGNPVLGRSGTEDNLESSYWHINQESGKVVYDGTLAWATYNLYASWSINKTFTLNFAVENILDLHYRPFASGISAAGRNFITSLRVNLGK
jgi:hemoglobin/transferrin/lactoferrin receptor protein